MPCLSAKRSDVAGGAHGKRGEQHLFLSIENSGSVLCIYILFAMFYNCDKE